MSGRDRPPVLRFLLRYRTEFLFAALVTALFADYLFSDQLLYGSDSIPSGLFFRGLLVDFVKEFHELPRWNPYILGGLPFLDATHGDTNFPTSALQFVMPVYRALGHKLIAHIFLAGVFMAFYLRSIELRPQAIAFGALAYMLSPVLVSYLFAGQDGKMYVTSLAPLVLGLLERGMRRGDTRTFLLLGVAIGFTILSSQIQMAYHCMWFLGALFVVRLVWPLNASETSRRGFRVTALFGVSIAVGLLIAAIQLFPAVAYVKHPAGFSVRSERTDYEHASSWSLHPEEAASMIVPEFCNAPRGYWGRNIFKYNSDYVGILTLLLGALALRRERNATRWYLSGLAVFAVLYSLGEHTPVHRLFYAVVPQVKLFRAPPLVMFGASFGLCALAAHAIHDLETISTRGATKGGGVGLVSWVLYVGLGVAGAIAILGLSAAPFTGFWNDLLFSGIEPAKKQIQLANLPAFRTGAFVAAAVLAAGSVIVFGRMRGLISERVMFWGLVTLMVFDLWRIDSRFKTVVDPEPFTRPDALLQPIIAETRLEKFRVMPVARKYSFNELGYFGIESVLGFHDNELAWYRELRSDPETGGLLATTPAGYAFLRFLNVKYILHESPDYPNPLPVPGYLPRFWLVDQYEVVPEREDVVSRVLDAGFDPSRSVILEENPGFQAVEPERSVPGRVIGYEYGGNEITVRVAADRECLLVHSENWFPYWRAFRNEEEIPIYRANGTIRAIPLVPGEQTVQIRFRSNPFELGKWITSCTLAALLFVFAAQWIIGRRRAP